jgi:MauM/NapG family ferredoxin protein
MTGRRHFLARAVRAAGLSGAVLTPFLVTRLNAPVVANDKEYKVRPPGALDESQFSGECIGCGLCGGVCPVQCIQFHRSSGGGQLGTPYIKPQDKGCILCGKCSAVCPTEALSVVSIEDVDMGIAQIDRNACYPWVDRGICGACVSICPLGDKAIGFEMWNQYRPVVTEQCVGCGLCVEVCPHPSLPIHVVQRAGGSIAKHIV